jgi:hypothetical protein
LSSITQHTERERPHGDPPSYRSSLYGVDYWIYPPTEGQPDKRRICYRPNYIFALIVMGLITMAMILGVVFATLREKSPTQKPYGTYVGISSELFITPLKREI